jgi:NADPH2:quinone reductase
MKTLCVNADRSLEVRELATPEHAAPGHLIIRVAGSAINPGDRFFLRNPAGLPPRPNDVWGASAAGTVTAVGEGVSSALVGKKVAVYRSLVSSDSAIGCWSEHAQLPVNSCCVLADDADPLDHCGSLVNMITPYAFWQQAKAEGHQGILVTAGSSSTGIAMLAIARAEKVPAVALVSTEEGKARVEALGASASYPVIVQSDPDFDTRLAEATVRAGATAVFEGVSGDLLTRILPLLAPRSTVYGYGFLGGHKPFSVLGQVMMARSLTIKNFSNFATRTVQEPPALAAALAELGRLSASPHFRTRRGREFRFAEIDAALAYEAKDGSRAILVP